MLGATRSKSEREILAGGAKRFDVQGGVSEFLLYLSSRIRKLRQADITIRLSRKIKGPVDQWGQTVTDPHKIQLIIPNGLAINCCIFE